VNAMIEPRSADEGVSASLNRARALVEVRDFDSAILQYFQLLDRDIDTPLRGEVLTNLGVALFMSVRGTRDAAAAARLSQARDLLATAVACRPRAVVPAAWATTRANLAVVCLALHEATGNRDDLMAAHLALDGVEQAMQEAGDTAMHDWVLAIRDKLADLGDRRSTRRR
jgi:hypothetical protein